MRAAEPDASAPLSNRSIDAAPAGLYFSTHDPYHKVRRTMRLEHQPCAERVMPDGTEATTLTRPMPIRIEHARLPDPTDATPIRCASQEDGDNDSGLSVEEAKPALKRPPLFKVLLVNDDYTPMEFVVHVLETFFAMTSEKATQVMLHVHTRGVGVCGVFTRDIAETKVSQVNDFSRQNHHPLLCTMEEA